MTGHEVNVLLIVLASLIGGTLFVFIMMLP
jgi:hypothetical protein